MHRWAGRELADLALGVIRQLEFQTLEFDLVLIGSLFKGGSLLTEPMEREIRAVAPGARSFLLPLRPLWVVSCSRCAGGTRRPDKTNGCWRRPSACSFEAMLPWGRSSV